MILKIKDSYKKNKKIEVKGIFDFYGVIVILFAMFAPL